MSGLFPFFLISDDMQYASRFSEKETNPSQIVSHTVYMYKQFCFACLFVCKFDKIKQTKDVQAMNENDSKDSSIYARLKSL